MSKITHLLLTLTCAVSASTSLLSVTVTQPSTGTSGAAIHVAVSGLPLAGLTTSPATLVPAFAPATHDYAVRCAPGANPIALRLTAQPGWWIATAGRGGPTVTVTVSLVESQAVIVETLGGRYWIRCLPHDFPQTRVSRPGTPPPGWYATGNATGATTGTSGTYAMVLDQNGTPVWYAPVPGGVIDVEPLRDQTLGWVPNLGPGIGTDPHGAFTLLHLRTRTTRALAAPIPPTDPHELHQLANGDLMMIGSPLRSGVDLRPLGASFDVAHGTMVDCVVQEVDTAGHLVWQWRASDHVGLRESVVAQLLAVGGHQVADVYHCNSVDVDPAGRDVLVSLRQTSGVYRIDRATGRVRWKLGGTAPSERGARHLTIAHDPEGTFSEQHDARFQPGGRVSLFDNHSGLPAPGRGVEYAIDDRTAVATADWQYTNPTGLNTFATGSFRPDQGGRDNVIAWGFTRGSGFTEVDAAGRVQLQLSYPNGEFDYRVVKVPPEALDVDLLREAMDRRWQGS